MLDKNDEDLAELVCIHLGDGSLNLDKRKNRVTYRILYFGHPINDVQYFNERLTGLWSKFFEKPLRIAHSSDGTIRAICNSKEIFYLLNSLDLPIGAKGDIRVPDWIMSNARLHRSFLRGLFDTDGSFFLRKKYRDYNYYPSVKISSKSRNLIDDMSVMITKLRIKCCKSTYNTTDNRTGKRSEKSEVYVNGFNNVASWFNEVGSSNPRTTKKWSDYPSEMKVAKSDISV